MVVMCYFKSNGIGIRVRFKQDRFNLSHITCSIIMSVSYFKPFKIILVTITWNQTSSLNWMARLGLITITNLRKHQV
jgi:hypothetical protein